MNTRIETWTDAAAVGAAVMILADWAISVPFWRFESNPIAVAVGPWPVLAAKLVAIAGIGYLWFVDGAVREGRWSSRIAAALIWGILAMHAAVVANNVTAILPVITG
jgi:hypothetical protein